MEKIIVSIHKLKHWTVIPAACLPQAGPITELGHGMTKIRNGNLWIKSK
jgi:hypothetical protein